MKPNHADSPLPHVASPRRIWVALAVAACATVLIGWLNHVQDRDTVRMGMALSEFQQARGELTLAVVEVARAEDAGQAGPRGYGLTRIARALARLDAVLPRMPDAAAQDAELARALLPFRHALASSGAAGADPRRSHVVLEESFGAAVKAIDRRAAVEHRRMAEHGGEQMLLFNGALVLALGFIAAAAVAAARGQRVRRAAEGRIARLTQLYVAQSRINEAVMRADDFTALAQAVCRIAVADGGLECAIVRRFDASDNTLKVLAFHAPRTGMIGREVVPVGDGIGVSGAAFAGLRPVVIEDMGESPVTRHAAAGAAALGVHSAAAFPMHDGARPFGTFALFGPGRGFFDEEMTRLLSECAASLAFAYGKLAARSALAESERALLLAQQTGRIGSAVVDVAGGTWTTSPVGREILGIEGDHARPLEEFGRLLVPEAAGAALEVARANVASGAQSDTIYELVRPADGARRWIRVVTDTEFDAGGRPLRRIGTLQDVTETRLAERRILRLSRLYEALSRTNAAIARDVAFDTVCETVCRVLVEVGGMVAAMTRLADPERGALELIAAWGEVPEALHPKYLAIDAGAGVSPQAFRDREPCVVQDAGSAPFTQAFAAAAAASGVRAAAALPLSIDGVPFGTITVSSASTDAFDAQTMHLLSEVAEALAFAHAKHASDGARRASEARMSAIVATAMDAIITCDEVLRIVAFNGAAAQMFGMPQEQAIGMPLERLLPPAYREAHPHHMRMFGTGAGASRAMGRNSVVPALRADGTVFPAEASISHVRIDGHAFYTVIMRDITARLAAEQRITRLTHLYAALSRANEAIVREPDWQVLCDTVCRIIVEHGQVVSAVIRMPDAIGAQLVPFAGYGPLEGRLGGDRVDAGGTHPAAVAFRDGRATTSRELPPAPELAGALEYAERHGVRSVTVVPLMQGERALGVLTVFAGEASSVDDELERLMGDLANDLAFAWGRLEADAAIRESESRNRTLVENTPDAIRVICDDEVVMVNAAYARMFGPLGPDRSVAALLERLDAATAARVAGRLREVIEERRAVPFEEQVVRLPGGGSVPIEGASVPFVYEGRPAALSIMRDLSERHARQRALAEAERRYRGLVETSLSGIVLLRGETVEYANHGLAAMLGMADGALLVGSNLIELAGPGFAEVSRLHLQNLNAAPGRAFPHGRMRMRRVDGDFLDIDVTAASLELEGRVVVLVEMRDVTREVRAKAELVALNRELEGRIEARTAELTEANRGLEAANRDLESFSYSVAHDLRAPLRTMIGFASLMQMDIAEGNRDGIDAHIARIISNAERMNGLINGMLEVSRVSHGNLGEERVEMRALVAEVLRELAPAPAVKVTIGALPAVRGDTVMLRQVWANLLGNAVKYSAKQAVPQVTVDAVDHGHEWVFRVRDNGAGFDPAYADRLFKVFQRLHSASEFAGTGVGLAIVRRVVERHGGRVWAESRPGEGAVFQFALPASLIAHP